MVEGRPENPYTRGSPYGSSYADQDSVGTGTFGAFRPMDRKHIFFRFVV